MGCGAACTTQPMYVVTGQPDNKLADTATRMVLMVADLVQEMVKFKIYDGQAHLMVAASAHVGKSHSGVAGDELPQFFVLGEALAASVKLLETSAPGSLHMSKEFFSTVDVSCLPQNFQGVDKALPPADGEAVSYMVYMLPDSPMETVTVMVSVDVC